MAVQSLPPATDGSRVYVYSLLDPRDGSVRYIGQTCNPKLRLNGHASSIESWQPAKKRAWILDLRAHGLRPVFAVLCTVAPVDADATERAWIDLMVARGESLVNREGVGYMWRRTGRTRKTA